MRGLVKPTNVAVAQALDLVQWTLGDRKIRLYYQTALNLAGAMRVAAKACMGIGGENSRIWRDLAKYERDAPPIVYHREYRRSGELSNLKAWRVDVEGELVAVYLDDLVAKFEFDLALMAQAALHRAAQQAKGWAGDDSTAFVITARLTDAAENDRLGICSRDTGRNRPVPDSPFLSTGTYIYSLSAYIRRLTYSHHCCFILDQTN